jgi:hypothetical protein
MLGGEGILADKSRTPRDIIMPLALLSNAKKESINAHEF